MTSESTNFSVFEGVLTTALKPPPYVGSDDALNALLPQDIADLAWDIVLYNEFDREQVLKAYGLTHEDTVRLRELPLFMSETKHAQDALRDDPHIGVRRLAKTHLAKRVNTLNSMAKSDLVEAKDRLNAIKLLAVLAGVDKISDKNGSSGPSININFGAALGARLQAGTLTVDAGEVQ